MVQNFDGGNIDEFDECPAICQYIAFSLPLYKGSYDSQFLLNFVIFTHVITNWATE